MTTTITNNANSKSYTFRATAPINNRVEQPVINFPFVNQSSNNNLLFRFTGQTERLSFRFSIYNNGSDASSGDSIITIQEQIDYLKNTIFGANFDTSFTITDTRYAPSGKSCVIELVSFDDQPGSSGAVFGEISVVIGTIAGSVF